MMLNLDRAISSSSDIEEKLELQRQIRMYSINGLNMIHRPILLFKGIFNCT
jgi:hypothetical protein